MNPCPKSCPRELLHVYPAMMFKEPPLHRRTGVSRASTKFLHRPARAPRRPISLLSMFGAVAGVQRRTSQSIKPRERDLGDLHLFFLVRILTRPTNHPRHAVCASNLQSKPVRPRFCEDGKLTSFLGHGNGGMRSGKAAAPFEVSPKRACLPSSRLFATIIRFEK